MRTVDSQIAMINREFYGMVSLRNLRSLTACGPHSTSLSWLCFWKRASSVRNGQDVVPWFLCGCCLIICFHFSQKAEIIEGWTLDPLMMRLIWHRWGPPNGSISLKLGTLFPPSGQRNLELFYIFYFCRESWNSPNAVFQVGLQMSRAAHEPTEVQLKKGSPKLPH